MKTLKRRFFVTFLSICMVAGTIGTFPLQSNASAPPTSSPDYESEGPTPGPSVFQPYLNQKTLDLADSGVDITLTNKDRQECAEQADQWALSWLKNYLILTDEQAEASEEAKAFDKSEGYIDMYWFKDIVVSEDLISAKREDLLKQLGKKDTAGAVLRDAAVMSRLTKELGENASSILAGKVREIENDLLSDRLSAQMNEKLNVQFDFQAEQIPEKEYSKFGIDSQAVRAGELNEPVKIHTVDFGADGQFYDAVLEEYMKGVFSGDIPLVNINDVIRLGDGRDIIDHILFIDAGSLRSSDDSQNCTAGFRGGITTKELKALEKEYEREGKTFDKYDEAKYTVFPGWHCLLEVCDAMSTYRWARYGLPGSKYSETFNLHLNPAVIYRATDPRADLITEAVFDGDGRLISVSKPYAYAEQVEKLVKENRFGIPRETAGYSGEAHLKPGVYRYKVKETTNEGKELNGARLKENFQEVIMDIIVGRYDEVNVAFYENLRKAEMTASLNDTMERGFQKDREKIQGTQIAKLAHAFENGFVRDNEPEPEVPEVEIVKTIEGSEMYELRSLDESFGYEISAKIPEGVKDFQIYDDLDKALEFADPEETTVSIGGEALTGEAKAKALSQTVRKLTVRLDEEMVKAGAGKELSISFRVRLGADADLLAYENLQIPNTAYCKYGNTTGQNYGVALLSIPDELITPGTTEPPDRPEASENPSKEKAGTAAGEEDLIALEEEIPTQLTEGKGEAPASGESKGGKGSASRTGDSGKLILPLIMLIAAATGGAVVFRRKAGHRS